MRTMWVPDFTQLEGNRGVVEEVAQMMRSAEFTASSTFALASPAKGENRTWPKV